MFYGTRNVLRRCKAMKIEKDVDLSHYGDMQEWVEEKLNHNEEWRDVLIECTLEGYSNAQNIIEKCFDIAKIIGNGCQIVELSGSSVSTYATREYLEQARDEGFITLFTRGPVYYVIY